MSQSLMGVDGSEAAPFEHRMTEMPDQLWERWWLWCSERFNPIVIKEVRQSLKSRQFTISFGLTLIAAIGWTLIAVSMLVPRIYYMPGGAPLLVGFFCILTLPLMVIIPFSAFRSLTAETEESTFELLSISALSASQIVYGKMASACLQIVLYLSALAPCIVLTYLLRGVGLYTILFLLGWTVLFSVCETALALLVAAVSRTRLIQNGVSVLVLAGLLLGIFLWLTLLINQGVDLFGSPSGEEFLGYFAVLTVVALIVSLVLRAAAAAIDFPSENHSTPLRRRLLLMLSVALFWSFMGLLAARQGEIVVVIQVFVFIVLMIIGALMTGERGVISPRAQRTLPRTFAGRIFLTWMYPGAGLGYIFLICIYAALIATLAIMEVYMQSTSTWRGRESGLVSGLLLLGYLAIYLGFNRLLMLAVSRNLPGRMIGSVAALAVVLLLAHLLPLLIVFYWNDYREIDYAWHQAFNIFWSVYEASEDLSLDIAPTSVIVSLCAMGVFGLNLLLSTRDVMLVRVAQPPRVRDESQRSEPAPAPQVDPFAD